MLEDTVYKGLFQKQTFLGIPANAFVASLFITVYVYNFTQNPAHLILVVISWCFFYFVHRKDRHIIDISILYLQMLADQKTDRKIRAVIYD
jgi:type IV secretory pathway VirB3-like protein